MMHPRLAAAGVLQGVRRGGSLSRELPAALAQADVESHPTIQALSYGALRQYELIDALLGLLLQKPLKAKDRIVTDLLRIALFELLDAARPDYAVVDSTVRLVKQKRRWAAGLANAVLRRFLRERETLLDTARQQPSARYLLPDWLLGKLRKAWPDDFDMLAQSLASPAPMTLRVDLSRVSRKDYLLQLDAAGMAADAHPLVASAITLRGACDVTRLPGFLQGQVSVQDAAAQLAGWLLDVAPGQRVLDACAAPGGKTVHLLEQTAGEAAVTAIELEPRRVERLGENIRRSGYHAEVVVADAGSPAAWWDGIQYDRILLDAPCSATGVIRRHPDIKRHRQPDDIVALVAQQARLLENLWGLLRPGGLLLYATCSILPEENWRQVERFCTATADCHEAVIEAEWGRAMVVGRQVLPGENALDGFYYAGLRKAEDQPVRHQT